MTRKQLTARQEARQICLDAHALIDYAVEHGTLTEMEGSIAKFKICRQHDEPFPLPPLHPGVRML
jgi:hypothetical protein